HIVQIFEVGEAYGLPYLVLEFCPGGTLADRLRGMPCPLRQAVELIADLAGAIECAHQNGIVHRDLKPANILLAVVSDQWPVVSEDSKQGPSRTTDHLSRTTDHWSLTTTPKITDFGLAKRLDVVGHTQSGAVVGTPSYMAPEQARGDTRAIG